MSVFLFAFFFYLGFYLVFVYEHLHLAWALYGVRLGLAWQVDTREKHDGLV